MAAGWNLVELMRDLSDKTPNTIDPADLIDDPRWIIIRGAAASFLDLLRSDSKDAA